MATVSFTIATTSISKSWGGERNHRGLAGGPGCPAVGGFGGPRGRGSMRSARTRLCTRMERPFPGTRRAPAAPSRGQPRGRQGPPAAAVPAQTVPSSHPSPFDGVSQEPDHVVPFRARGFEALGPIQEDALERGLRAKRVCGCIGVVGTPQVLAPPSRPLTLSMSSCRTGKEKVKPRGSFLCFIWCLSRKSEMHSEM